MANPFGRQPAGWAPPNPPLSRQCFGAAAPGFAGRAKIDLDEAAGGLPGRDAQPGGGHEPHLPVRDPEGSLHRSLRAATPLCRVEARGDGGRKEWQQTDIPVGQEAEVTFRSGKQMICLFSCSQATDIDGQTSKTVNCKDMNIGGPPASEIVVVDGPMKPDAGEATWENRMNPVFNVNRLKPWLRNRSRIS